jgi:hypothetical protein
VVNERPSPSLFFAGAQANRPRRRLRKKAGEMKSMLMLAAALAAAPVPSGAR